MGGGGVCEGWVWVGVGALVWSRCPQSCLCAGITPEGTGFSLLARRDKQSLHMLRQNDKGIASLNGRKKGNNFGAFETRETLSV